MQADMHAERQTCMQKGRQAEGRQESREAIIQECRKTGRQTGIQTGRLAGRLCRQADSQTGGNGRQTGGQSKSGHRPHRCSLASRGGGRVPRQVNKRTRQREKQKEKATAISHKKKNNIPRQSSTGILDSGFLFSSFFVFISFRAVFSFSCSGNP